ncbi:MMS19 nucleotide excision repair protein homolog isoform X1 [Cucurbita pepo subsp. pepo]|uniref:MMS19 nucleotide excision repair protein homolog isoform X1 n=1 Tax=Cucurbita pepo subsp. pepo TaxID=3664 RepID=UPI000C9D9CB2|nr:MMS19 nucleotide excision repair protein homolog isoform X1 [Cucurbita pepo subsp. pepo]
MAELSKLTHYIESFVDVSHTPSQQATSLEAIISLVKNNVVTIKTLVTEMGMYLTITDHIIRGRGILLLGEVLACLASKPLDDATIHSLMTFFTERLEDWKALRGALIGCLALMRRKTEVGAVSQNDAKSFAQSYFQNLQVQSLGQHDRKLSFELLVCLLEHYPDAVVSLGDDLVYGICEAIDGEKDPHCLMLTFHIVELVAKLFPDPTGTLASSSSDLFEFLGCYFPIHFTHGKEEDVDVTRNDLSQALMMAFSSNPLFEPFAIPLLLEKLSSSLPLAKIDSLKYLSDCTVKYGADRMEKHSEAIWSSVKEIIFTSIEQPFLSFNLESLDSPSFQGNEMIIEALRLLQKMVVESNGSFLRLIINDEDIKEIFNILNIYTCYNDLPLQSRQRLNAVGHILYKSANASVASCNHVFESFFLRLLDFVGISVDQSDNYKISPSRNFNFGALYLCIELLAACRDLYASCDEQTCSVKEKSYNMLQTFSCALVQLLNSTFPGTAKKDLHDDEFYCAVKGLRNLATFPVGSSPVSSVVFEDILLGLMSFITMNLECGSLWNHALKALQHIGSFVDRYHGSVEWQSYMHVVVEKIAPMFSLHDEALPLTLKLKMASDIGRSGRSYMLKIVQGIEEATSFHLSEVYSNGNSESVEILLSLLDCYSTKILPWFDEAGDVEEVILRITFNIWDQIEKCLVFSTSMDKALLDATMMALKLSVRSCSKESQNIIIQKAFNVLLTSSFSPSKVALSTTIPVQMEGLQLLQQKDSPLSRDEWILSLFASVIIALRPQIHVPDVRSVMRLLMLSITRGCIPAAQALGSMINKLSLKSDKVEVSNYVSLEEAIDIIFNTKFRCFHNESTRDGSEMLLTDLCSSIEKGSLIPVHAVVGLSWIGKGLLLFGHEKVRDVTMVFLQCLVSKSRTDASPLQKVILEKNCETNLDFAVMNGAADAFHILMSDSETCLNRKFHAILRPLYKQRFFSTMMPIFQSLVSKSYESLSRYMLYEAFAHVICDTPLTAILSDAKKVSLNLIPMLLDGLLALSVNIINKDVVYSLLLVLSGILMDKNGQEAVTENAHKIVDCLAGLTAFPHMMLVRETAIQCLVAVSELPHARIYPMRMQVLHAISKALDDPKRAVRQEAVRCRQAWASIASRSLIF